MVEVGIIFTLIIWSQNYISHLDEGKYSDTSESIYSLNKLPQKGLVRVYNVKSGLSVGIVRLNTVHPFI